jgi:signal transduction histidine kinase
VYRAMIAAFVSGHRSPRKYFGPSGSAGLIGLRERVAMAGGTFEAGPADARFTIRARFPLAADERSR